MGMFFFLYGFNSKLTEGREPRIDQFASVRSAKSNGEKFKGQWKVASSLENPELFGNKLF